MWMNNDGKVQEVVSMKAGVWYQTNFDSTLTIAEN